MLGVDILILIIQEYTIMNTKEKTIMTITCPGGAIEFHSPEELENHQYKPSHLQRFLDLVCSLLCKIAGQRPQQPSQLQIQDEKFLQDMTTECKRLDQD